MTLDVVYYAWAEVKQVLRERERGAWRCCCCAHTHCIAPLSLRTECLTVGLEHGVGAFARETRRHVKESEAFGLELESGFGLHAFPMVDADAHIDHGYPHTVVHHDFGHVF